MSLTASVDVGSAEVIGTSHETPTVRQVDVECPHAFAFPRRCVISTSRFNNVHEIDDILCVDRQRSTCQDGKLSKPRERQHAIIGQEHWDSPRSRRISQIR